MNDMRTATMQRSYPYGNTNFRCTMHKNFMPDHKSAYEKIGRAYGDKKDYDNAMGFYKKAIEFEPESAQYSYLGIGKIYSDKKDYDSAIEAYEKAIKKKHWNLKRYLKREVR